MSDGSHGRVMKKFGDDTKARLGRALCAAQRARPKRCSGRLLGPFSKSFWAARRGAAPPSYLLRIRRKTRVVLGGEDVGRPGKAPRET